ASRARDRRVLRAAQRDDAVHRPSHDGEGRVRLGRAGRRRGGTAGRGRLHRRTGGTARGVGGGAPLGGSRHALANPGALFQAAAASFADPGVRRLAAAVELAVAPDLEARFPADRWARVALRVRGRAEPLTRTATARGDPDAPLPDAEIAAKFDALCATGGLAP